MEKHEKPFTSSKIHLKHISVVIAVANDDHFLHLNTFCWQEIIPVYKFALFQYINKYTEREKEIEILSIIDFCFDSPV